MAVKPVGEPSFRHEKDTKREKSQICRSAYADRLGFDRAMTGPRRALVTGGASGLGRACAAHLRAEGHEVVTADIADGADLRLDVTDAAAVTAAVAAVGRVDILLNSAGIIGVNKVLWETTEEEWAAVFAVNVFGIV